jgi:cytochrome c-type biogenesis protein CcmH
VSGELLFWLGAGLLTALAVLALLRPLLAPRGDTATARAPYDLAVYRDQLAEVERDLARGVLTPEAAEAARTEIERRILAAADAPARMAGPAPAGRGAVPRRLPKMLAGTIAVVLPLLALGVYVQLGAPGLPGAPVAERPVATDSDMAVLVDQLAQRMAERPDDVRGWLLLARSYGSLGRYQDSATAYAAAIAHGAEGAEVQSAYGEALTAAANGQITVAAKMAFDAAVAQDPGEPRARFYLALAKAQAGKLDEALADWVTLEAQAPADAPWRGAVTAQIEQAAAELGLDAVALPGRVALAPPPEPAEPSLDESGGESGPSATDMATAADMTPEERDAFIRSMVASLAARLETTPDDLEGWLRLARAYGVLGEAEMAQDAWARAAALAPDNVEVLLGYAQAIRDASVEEAPLPPEFAATVAKARAIDPENPLGLYLGGLAESAAGNTEAARGLWEKLRALLPEGSPERAEIDARLAGLPAS